MRVGGHYHYLFIHSRQTFPTEELNKRDVWRISTHHMPLYIEGFFWMLCSRHVCWCCVHHYTYLVCSYVISKNNGHKFYLSKSMQAADEKLTMNWGLTWP